MKEAIQDVILLNNLFNGKYIGENIGGEIINMYQSDNENYYIYVNPYGNVDKIWDNRIKYVLFIRSVGNRVVKVIGKAEIEEQICLEAVKSTRGNQEEYIDKEGIKYGGVEIYKLLKDFNYFITFKATGIYKAKEEIYLSPSNENNNSTKNLFILGDIIRINNQSQKLYIEPSNKNHRTLEGIINNNSLWEEKPVDKVNPRESEKLPKSFLSIIKKENDESVNSNLLAYFLENDKIFWKDFVKRVLGITDKNVIEATPIITRESIGNIDLFIEAGEYAIVIENKIKSGINGRKSDGYSQLEKYVEVAEKFQDQKNVEDVEEFKDKKYKPENIYFYIFRPNYNNEDYQVFDKGKKYNEIKYSKLYEIIEKPKPCSNFDEFKRVVKKHSAEYNNELFEIMNERFIELINKNEQKSNS